MRNLRVTILQADLSWHNIGDNLARFDGLIRSLKEPSDLVLLPEMFTTGFTMQSREFAEGMDGSGVEHLTRWAGEKGADIAGSLIVRDGGRYYNRLVWAKPGGAIFTYDKRHLFRMAGEEGAYSAGEKNITIDINGWKIRPFICYDLRFPVWTRNRNLEYDAAVFVANWPEKRYAHWQALLRARAVENQCYVIGVNRVGADGNGIAYRGDSSIIDFAGNTIFEKSHEECAHTVELSYGELQNYREAFPAWKDADGYTMG